MLNLTKKQREKLAALRDEELALKRPNAAKVSCIDKILASDTDCRSFYMTPGSEHSRAIGEIIEPSDAK